MNRNDFIKQRNYNLIMNLRNKMKNIPQQKKRLFFIILILIIICLFVFIFLKESQKQKYVEYNGENLSESKYPGYKELIDALMEQHPNWTFTLFYTKLDWEEVIANEGHKDNTEFPLNLPG